MRLLSFVACDAGYGSNLGLNPRYGSGAYGSGLGGYGSLYGRGMYV